MSNINDKEHCTTCNGGGRVFVGIFYSCPTCGGSGHINKPLDPYEDENAIEDFIKISDILNKDLD